MGCDRPDLKTLGMMVSGEMITGCEAHKKMRFFCFEESFKDMAVRPSRCHPVLAVASWICLDRERGKRFDCDTVPGKGEDRGVRVQVVDDD